MKDSKTTNWLGKEVKYYPGKIFACAKSSVIDPEHLIFSFHKSLRIRGSYQPNLYEILVEPRLTLEVANAMIESHNFRFVELDREGYF